MPMVGEPSFSLAWRYPQGALEHAAVPPEDGARLPFETHIEEADDGRATLVLSVAAPVEIVSATCTLTLAVSSADALFLNGYNSWTDSCERPPEDAMVGLTRTPKPIIRHWVLDASGDYRFIAQDGRPGHQHGVGYGYLRSGDTVTLFGECLPDAGITAIHEEADEGRIAMVKEGPARVLQAGERLALFSLFVAEGTLASAFARYVDALGVTLRPAPLLAGYSSWYRHYGDIDAGKLEHDLTGLAEAFDTLDLGPVVPLFQIDDGYAKVGDWTHPDPVRFPEGMGMLASDIEEAGMVPGLWMAPFVCEKESRTFAEHQGWILRDGTGALVQSGSHWSGGYALDILNPEVREHVRESLDTATRVWGFRFLKLDFLYAAALVPHGGKNRADLMADGLDLLRASVPDETLFDFCGVPVMSAFGRSEYCRIGCDVGLDWDGPAYMRITGRERVSTKRSLANTLGRAHLNGRVFLNDPDVFFLRKDVKLTDGQKEELLLADARLGGMLLTSDDMGEWDERQRALFQDALALFVSRAASR